VSFSLFSIQLLCLAFEILISRVSYWYPGSVWQDQPTTSTISWPRRFASLMCREHLPTEQAAHKCNAFQRASHLMLEVLPVRRASFYVVGAAFVCCPSPRRDESMSNTPRAYDTCFGRLHNLSYPYWESMWFVGREKATQQQRFHNKYYEEEKTRYINQPKLICTCKINNWTSRVFEQPLHPRRMCLRLPCACNPIRRAKTNANMSADIQRPK